MNITRRTVAVTAISIVAAAVLGLISMAHHFAMMVAAGAPMPWRHSAIQELPFWCAAAVLTPPLAATLRRFPDRAASRRSRIAQHLLIGAVWTAAQTTLEIVVARLFDPMVTGASRTALPSLAGFMEPFTVSLTAYVGIVGVIYAATYYIRFREREVESSRLEARLAETRLQLLRTQLNPHFLFNAMNTIAMLTRAGKSAESVAMLLSLSALMRDALRADGPLTVALSDELSMLDRYIDVERARFGGNLIVEVDVPEELRDAHVLSFLLQPLVENAIKHGRATLDGTARIVIEARRSGETLVLSVWDNGSSGAAVATRSDGIGLNNVRERLAEAYGARQSFTIGPAQPAGTRAELTMPYCASSSDTAVAVLANSLSSSVAPPTLSA